MKEYIEREAAINELTEENLVLNLDSVMDGLSNQIKRSAHRILASLPAADVVEVRKAKWITGNENPRTYGRIRAMCGRCGAFALYEFVNVGSFKECLSNYCPNCGADMRGEEKEEEE